MKKLITLIFIVLLIGCKTNATNDTNRLNLNIDEAKNIALGHSFVKKDEAEFVVEEIIDGDNPYFLLAYSSNDKNYLYHYKAKLILLLLFQFVSTNIVILFDIAKLL